MLAIIVCEKLNLISIIGPASRAIWTTDKLFFLSVLVRIEIPVELTALLYHKRLVPIL